MSNLSKFRIGGLYSIVKFINTYDNERIWIPIEGGEFVLYLGFVYDDVLELTFHKFLFNEAVVEMRTSLEEKEVFNWFKELKDG